MARNTEASIQASTHSNTRTNSRSTKPKNIRKNAVSKNNKTISRKKPLKLDIISTDQRLQMIRELAYSFAEQRGFIAGNEQADWLQAEHEIDAILIN